MLDERLSLAASLYTPCSLGADIGTDHGLLPCHLLEQGICGRMLLSDVSPKALAHAAAEIARRGLTRRAALVCADGLYAIDEPCGCISITGMGGRTIRSILTAGRDRLHGAALILCPHTEPGDVRGALQEIGYRLDREEPCLCAGHAYIVLRAVPGAMSLSEDERRWGSLLFRSASPMLGPYLEHCESVLIRRLEGLRAARIRDESAIRETQRALQFYRERSVDKL